MAFSNSGFASLAVVACVSVFAFGCASAPAPAPKTPLEEALAAPPSSDSRANDPAYNPPGEDQFTVNDKALEPTAPRSQAPGTAVRADGAAKTAKQKIHAAAP